jgi:hypothetical protein
MDKQVPVDKSTNYTFPAPRGKGIMAKLKYLSLALVAALMAGVGGYVYYQFYYPYSTGDRAGFITKFSEKGNPLCKSWEGEMSMGGFRGAKGGTTNVFDFTARDSAFIKPIQEAMNTGMPLRLSYKETHNFIRCFGETPYSVIGVERLNLE